MNELATRKLDSLAEGIRSLPGVDVELTHRFTPGLYSREIKLPADSLNISKIHKTEHQYIISKGVVQVYDASTGKSELIIAPRHGITKPGTQRAVYAITDAIWTTCHPTELKDVDKIEAEIIQEPDK